MQFKQLKAYMQRETRMLRFRLKLRWVRRSVLLGFREAFRLAREERAAELESFVAKYPTSTPIGLMFSRLDEFAFHTKCPMENFNIFHYISGIVCDDHVNGLAVMRVLLLDNTPEGWFRTLQSMEGRSLKSIPRPYGDNWTNHVKFDKKTQTLYVAGE